MTTTKETRLLEHCPNGDKLLTIESKHIFVGHYAYFKKNRNGESKLVCVDGHYKVRVRRYIHFKEHNTLPKNNQFVFSGNY